MSDASKPIDLDDRLLAGLVFGVVLCLVAYSVILPSLPPAWQRPGSRPLYLGVRRLGSHRRPFGRPALAGSPSNLWGRFGVVKHEVCHRWPFPDRAPIYSVGGAPGPSFLRAI
jgi:hypothetical protein